MKARQKMAESVEDEKKGLTEEHGPKQKFGTQIVNYKPNFVEKSDDSSEEKSRERVFSQGKRTF